MATPSRGQDRREMIIGDIQSKNKTPDNYRWIQKAVQLLPRSMDNLEEILQRSLAWDSIGTVTRPRALHQEFTFDPPV